MITVTDRAATQLQAMLTRNSAGPAQGVKLSPTGKDAIGMSIDTPGANDVVVFRGEAPLLIVDGSIKGALDGMEIDYETTLVEGQARSTFKLRSRP